jgi:hypothetical protein
MAIIHYCLFAAQSAADFSKAINSYMAISTTLVDDVKKAYQESTSIVKEDSDNLFNILMKNVLGMLLSLLSYIRDSTH